MRGVEAVVAVVVGNQSSVVGLGTVDVVDVDHAHAGLMASHILPFDQVLAEVADY